MQLPKEINDLIEQHKPPPEKQENLSKMSGNELAEWRKNRLIKANGKNFETVTIEGHKYIICKGGTK